LVTLIKQREFCTGRRFCAPSRWFDRYEHGIDLREHLGVIESERPAVLILIVNIQRNLFIQASALILRQDSLQNSGNNPIAASSEKLEGSISFRPGKRIQLTL